MIRQTETKNHNKIKRMGKVIRSLQAQKAMHTPKNKIKYNYSAVFLQIFKPSPTWARGNGGVRHRFGLLSFTCRRHSSPEVTALGQAAGKSRTLLQPIGEFRGVIPAALLVPCKRNRRSAARFAQQAPPFLRHAAHRA